MCITMCDEYEACGHTMELVKWKCVSNHSDQHQKRRRFTTTKGKKIDGDRYQVLCNKCFLLPYPRKSDNFKPRGQHWHIGAHREFFENEHEIAEGMLERAKKSGINEFSDPFDFVKASFPEDGDAFFRMELSPTFHTLARTLSKISKRRTARYLPPFGFHSYQEKWKLHPLNIAFCQCSYRITSTTADLRSGQENTPPTQP
jgi:hypothetical protein